MTGEPKNEAPFVRSHETTGEPKNEAPFNRKIPNSNPDAPHVHHFPTGRERLYAYMTATATHHTGWTYMERRPLSYPPTLAETVVADCSFACAILNRWAALPDPTGGSYDCYGNSTSMYHHLKHIELKDARVGDFVVFGPEGSWHATIIYKASPTDPMLWSFGHQGAPNVYALSADRRRPFTVLRNEAP